MVMVGMLLSCLPYVSYLLVLGVDFLPYALVGSGTILQLLPWAGMAGFALLVGGLYQCLKAPPESDSRNLLLFAGATLVALRFVAIPSVRMGPLGWLIPPLNLAVDLALLLALCRLAVYYRRRDLLGSFFVGAGLALIQTLIALPLSVGWLAGLTTALLLLTIGCVALSTVLVSVAVGRLAVSAGEGPPREDFL